MRAVESGENEQAQEDDHYDQPPNGSGEKRKRKNLLIKPQSNSFPITLKNQNLAMLSFDQLPVDESDIELLKKWIDLFKENLTEQREESERG